MMHNFWAVADLAEYYASSDRPLDERQRLARRYLDDLQARFRNDRHLAQIVKRIERKLRAS